MKIKLSIWIASTLCLLSVRAEPINDKDKVEFIKYYREAVRLSEEFPNQPEVKAIFVDLDGDGKDEVLATSHGSFYETGWLWAAFRKNFDKWVPVKGYDEGSKSVRSGSGVNARPGEIFRVTKNDGTIEFIILAENFDKLAPESLGPLQKSRFFLDKEGVLHEVKIPDLERYLAYGSNRISGTYGLINKMETLKVELFKD